MIQSALQQYEQQHGRYFLKRKIRFYLFFHPFNTWGYIFIVLTVSWQLKHLSVGDTSQPLPTGTEAGTECIYFTLSFCIWLHPSCPSFRLLCFKSAQLSASVCKMRWEKRDNRWVSLAHTLLCSAAEQDRLVVQLLSSPSAQGQGRTDHAFFHSLWRDSQLRELKMFLQAGRTNRSPKRRCAPRVPCHTEKNPADPGRALMFWARSSTCACHFHW